MSHEAAAREAQVGSALIAEIERLRELLREAREFLGDNDKEDSLIRAIDAALGDPRKEALDRMAKNADELGLKY